MAHSCIENYPLIAVVDFQLFHISARVAMLYPAGLLFLAVNLWVLDW